jgi:proline iminopeptidase
VETGGEADPDFEFPPNMEVNREVSASWAEFTRNPDFLRRVANLDVPALFVYGERDIRPLWPVKQTATPTYRLTLNNFPLARQSSNGS